MDCDCSALPKMCTGRPSPGHSSWLSAVTMEQEKSRTTASTAERAVRSSVFDISRKAFEGYTTLTPALLLGVRWKRFTAAGAIASILAGNAVLGLAWAGHWPRTELLPVFWALVVGSLAAVLVSWLTPSRPEATARAFGE